jgi:hypothetical protein
VVLEPALAWRGAPPRHHECAQPLAKPLVIDAADRDLVDGLVARKELLDLLWVDVFAARDDHLILAPIEEQSPVLVEVAVPVQGVS